MEILIILCKTFQFEPYNVNGSFHISTTFLKKSKEQGSQKMHQRITDVKMIAFRMKKKKQNQPQICKVPSN